MQLRANPINKEFIYGVQSLADHYEVTKRTIERWNRAKKIPWEKTGPSKNSSVRISTEAANLYYNRG